VAVEMMNVKEKEYARSIEDRENLEKKFQQLQTSEDGTKHEKMTIDYEVSKLKVHPFAFSSYFLKITFKFKKKTITYPHRKTITNKRNE
jgi:hypothetical protein